MTNSTPAPVSSRWQRWREAASLISNLVRIHPRPFAVAVAGAAVFAMCTVASTWAIRFVIDRVILPRFEQGHVSMAVALSGLGAIIAIGFVRAAGVIVRRTWAGRAQRRIGETLSGHVVDRLVQQPITWHQRRPTGDLAARAGIDVDAATEVLAPLPFASSVVILIVVSSAWLITTDVPLGLFAVALFPILITLNVSYQHRVDRYFDEAQHHVGDLSAAVFESFEAVQIVKSFGAEQRETERLGVIAGRLRDARTQAVYLRGTFDALLDAVPSLASIGLIVLGSMRIRSGDLTVGDMGSAIYLFALLVFPLRIVGYALSSLPHSLAGWRRLREVLDEPLVPDPQRNVATAPAGVGICCDSVHFGFEPDRPVLSDLSVTIPAGSTTAIVGITGAGKSTLLRVMSGLLEPHGGSVAIAPGVRSLVLQESFLLSGNVRDNILLGLKTTDEQVWHALAQTESTDFVQDLPSQLDTELGERGVSLSGGQRQRIALARALVRRPTVLLLDDTTSALDPGTELRVVGNLRQSLKGTTVVMVASRPSTLALAEHVVFLQNGAVAGWGSHDNLLASNDHYRELMEAFEADRGGQELADE